MLYSSTKSLTHTQKAQTKLFVFTNECQPYNFQKQQELQEMRCNNNQQNDLKKGSIVCLYVIKFSGALESLSVGEIVEERIKNTIKIKWYKPDNHGTCYCGASTWDIAVYKDDVYWLQADY